MGTLVGHVAPGFAFLVLGLWQLFNHIKLHIQNPNSYISPTWFPTSKFKYLELYLIMLATTASISMELFIGPARHQPFDTDGTIPSYHLHNFEHALISMSFFAYAVSSIIIDKIENQAKLALTQFLASIAFFFNSFFSSIFIQLITWDQKDNTIFSYKFLSLSLFQLAFWEFPCKKAS